MPTTRFWLLRHALVERSERAVLYGTKDVMLCQETIAAQAGAYAALAAALPRPAAWVVTPLSRTRRTAEQIFAAGYPSTALQVTPGLAEQDLGAFQGLPHAELPSRLRMTPHPFWPLGPDELPPGGETMTGVVARVGPCMDDLAARWSGQDVVVIAHGGSIRAAVAHAMGVGAGPVLHLSVQNISTTLLEHHEGPESDGQAGSWRVAGVNLPPHALTRDSPTLATIFA